MGEILQLIILLICSSANHGWTKMFYTDNTILNDSKQNIGDPIIFFSFFSIVDVPFPTHFPSKIVMKIFAMSGTVECKCWPLHFQFFLSILIPNMHINDITCFSKLSCINLHYNTFFVILELSEFWHLLY